MFISIPKKIESAPFNRLNQIVIVSTHHCLLLRANDLIMMQYFLKMRILKNTRWLCDNVNGKRNSSRTLFSMITIYQDLSYFDGNNNKTINNLNFPLPPYTSKHACLFNSVCNTEISANMIYNVIHANC